MPLQSAHAPSGTPTRPEPVSAPAIRSGPGARVATPEAWNRAALMIARGDALKDVAARVGCSRSTLWRVLQRSERLRTRVAEEQRFLAVEAAGRFRGLQGAAVDAIEAAVMRGNLRAAFWVADRLGLARIDIGEARAGLALAEDEAAWGEAPPPDPAVYALDGPLVLEPEALEAEAPDAPVAPVAQVASVARVEAPPEAPAVEGGGGPARRATFPEGCFTTFHKPGHKAAAGKAVPPFADLLKTLPRTAPAWPGVSPMPPVAALRLAG